MNGLHNWPDSDYLDAGKSFMKALVLNGVRDLSMVQRPTPCPGPGEQLLRVLFCGVCKTDAKMWDQGHRDLILPRVMGHEAVVVDEQARKFVIWPGKSCGQCLHCRKGRENLCDFMEIMGFHNDGGFADFVIAPGESLIPVPDNITPLTACFAEPMGCVFNAVSKLGLDPGQRVLIYGGGTVGLIAALVCRGLGGEVCVIEKDQAKIQRLAPFLQKKDILCTEETQESNFHCVINACPDPEAFGMGISKAGKGSRYAFFSGLAKDKALDTNLLNLVHYREISLVGAYGLTCQNMVDALTAMEEHQDFLAMLVQQTIPLGGVDSIMPAVLSGVGFKYVVDFRTADGKN